MTVIIFLIVLAVLVFVHELGHFLAARACGIRVDSFKIGFGPKVFAWRFKDKAGKPGETEYGVNWIPFGGYVKIFGENPDDENTNGPDAGRSFVHKPRYQQAIVLAAGVLCNFIFAWILYTIVFTAGVAVSTDSFPQYASRFQNQRIMVTDVMSGSPADKAGLKAGDILVSVGAPNAAKETIDAIPDLINASAGQSITVSYSRAGRSALVKVAPIQGLNPDDKAKYAIGIAMDNAADLRLPVWSAAWTGLEYTGELMKETVIGLYAFVANIFRGQADFSQVSGPIGIAGIVGNAATMGISYLLMVTAIISINLGIINLVPFPALDGGRILFVGLDGLFRRRIPAKFANAVNAVGFVLLMLLMIAVTYKDIVKLVG